MEHNQADTVTDYLDYLGQTLLELSECARTGHLIPNESGFYRVGGYKSLFPELSHVGATPTQIRSAIYRKTGPLYDTLFGAVEDVALHGSALRIDREPTEAYRAQFGYAPDSDLPHTRRG